MARLPYLEKGTSPDVDRVFAEVERLGRPVLNLYRVLANQPAALSAFLEMSRYVRTDSSLDAGLRELVILATAHELGQPYEIAHHTEAGLRAGLTDQKIAALAPGGSMDPLTSAERCAVEFARSISKHRTGAEPMFRLLETYFTPPEIVDLVVTIAWYHLCAVILGSLGVELEAGPK